jgi:hypothetical protein
MGHRGTTKPAPTPVNQLGRSFDHPARPYRWWEFRPTPPEAPEVFYPRVESYEEYVERRRLMRLSPGFWTQVIDGIVGFLLFLLVAGWLKLFLDSLE